MLTGRTRWRIGFLGRVVLQVEEHFEVADLHSGTGSREVTQWRDARIADVMNLPIDVQVMGFAP